MPLFLRLMYPNRSNRRALAPACGLLTLGVLLSSAVAQGQGGPAGASPPPAPQVVAFAADQGQWAWLTRSDTAVKLFTGAHGQPPQEVAQGTGWADVARGKNSLWVYDRPGKRIARFAPQPGSAPEAVAAVRGEAGGLLALGDGVLWVERAAPPTRFPWVPTAGPSLSLMSWENGAARKVGEWPAGSGKSGEPGPGDVIAGDGKHVFVRVRRRSSTEFVRFPLSGGAGERMGVESGLQMGLWSGGRFYWTAPSAETPFGSSIRQVKRAAAPGEEESLTDWLPSENLVELGGRVWAAGRLLYRLPERPGPPELVEAVSAGPSRTDGVRLIDLLGGSPKAVELKH